MTPESERLLAIALLALENHDRARARLSFLEHRGAEQTIHDTMLDAMIAAATTETGEAFERANAAAAHFRETYYA